ncbi:uncharacterized protein [Amphiura filiformis]|uniref:uncharacterized protein n=1 Tax=Amphiura filiformis TaxID=82378 RepID=UPI003B2234CC
MRCPEHGIDCTNEYQKLKPGFWWTWNFSMPTPESQNLLQEYKAFVNNLNTHDRNYDTASTRFDGPLPISFPCLRGIDSCPDLNGIDGSCGEGYEGWLCSRCSSDYYSWFEYCIKCPPIWRLIIEVFGVFILVCLVVTISIWDLKTKINERKENKNDKSLNRSLVYLLVARFKIVLGYYQIAGATFTSLHNVHWPNEVSKLAYLFRALELNIFKLLAKPRCYIDSLVLNIYEEFLIGLVFCGLAVFLPAIIYSLRWLYVKVYKKLSLEDVTKKLKGLRENCYFFVVLMLFISYLSLCSVILSLMPVACQEFCVDENNNYCLQRLRSDYSIDCQTQKHKNYVTTAYVSLLFVIGYPVCLFVLIYRRRPKLCQENADINDEFVDRPHSGDVNSALAEGSEDTGNVMNEGTIQVLDTEPLLHAEQHDLQLNPEDIEDVQGEHMEDINEDLQDDKIDGYSKYPLYVQFLCENYKPEYWYWEILELSRKVLQTSLVVLYGSEDPLSLGATIVLSMVFICSHAYFKPMQDSFEHWLQMTSLVAIFLNLVSAIVLLVPFTDTSGHRQTAMAVFIIVVNVSVVLLAVGNSTLIIWRAVKQHGRFGACSCRNCVTIATETVSVLSNVSRHSRRGHQTHANLQGPL